MGRLTDDDEHLLAFARLMARTFQTVDVMSHWNDPGYIKATVEIEMERLEKSVSDVKLQVGKKRALAPSRAGNSKAPRDLKLVLSYQDRRC